MRLTQLRLHPFAGVPDRAVEFKTGLNVLVGPNEAGKSTILQALRLVLFTPSRLTPSKLDKWVGDFFPVQGGDTVRVSLSFEKGDDRLELLKSWGGTSGSELISSVSGTLTGSSEVESRLSAALELGVGTWNNVLFTLQSEMGKTFEQLENNPGIAGDLAAILRTAVFETDGISVDQLAGLITSRKDSILSRWDWSVEGPEGNRGIKRPWKSGVGKLLEAWYEKEQSRINLGEAESYEKSVDRLNERIRKLNQKIDELDGFVSENEQIVKDAQNRKLLTAELQLDHEKMSRLSQVTLDWPGSEKVLEQLTASQPDLMKRKERLDREKELARKQSDHQQSIQVLERAQQKSVEVKGARNELEKMPVIDRTLLRRAQKTEAELARLRTSLTAGKLALELVAKVATEVEVQTDLNDSENRPLAKDQSLRLKAGGRVRLTHPEWELQVSSGDTDFDELQGSVLSSQEELEGLQGRLGCSDIAEAEKKLAQRVASETDVRRLENELDTILNGRDFEELKKEVASLEADRGKARDLETVLSDLAEVEGEIRTQNNKMLELQEQLTEWEDTYESRAKLLDSLVDLKTEIRSAQKRLDGLKPLPAGVADLDGFVRDFEVKKAGLDRTKKSLWGERESRAYLESCAPEESIEDLKEKLQVADREFEDVLLNAKAIEEITQAFSQVREEMDGQTMDPWMENLADLLSPLTSDRYVGVELDGDLPTGIRREDDLVLPLQNLSVGTRDSLALAVRLSMAKFFLKDLEGFLVLDDPLVEMDSARQAAAARIVQEFAKDKQVLFLTCHPAHADLLGGNRIRM